MADEQVAKVRCGNCGEELDLGPNEVAAEKTQQITEACKAMDSWTDEDMRQARGHRGAD